MLQVFRTSRFRKDYRTICRGSANLDRFQTAVRLLADRQSLSAEYRDHPLSGQLASFRECHLSGGLLLIYRVRGDLLELVRIGTHSQLFGR
jgi:mRNA interferase YafQ